MEIFLEELEQLTIFDTPIDSILVENETEKSLEETVVSTYKALIITENTAYIEEVVPYEIGDSVRVDIDSLDEEDVLNYYYLLDFLKKKGIVTKVIYKPQLQYEVAYGNTIACMYHGDLTI